VNVWIHNGFVKINEEKMSKSLGNFLMIKEILKEYHPEGVRLFLLSNHYRSPVDFTHQAIAEAQVGLEKIYALLDRMTQSFGTYRPHQDQEPPGALWTNFCESMDDDFNTARGLGLVFEAVRQTNRVLDGLQEAGRGQEPARLASVRADLMRVGAVLGICEETPTQFFEHRKTKALEREAIDESVVERLIAERAHAREQQDWARADEIRDQLASMNVVLEDRAEGTTWKVQT
jgi:cysteinyl-tRNA synthetase